MAERGAVAQEPWRRNAVCHDVQEPGHHAAAVPVGRCARCARGVRRNPVRSLLCALPASPPLRSPAVHAQSGIMPVNIGTTIAANPVFEGVTGYDDSHR